MPRAPETPDVRASKGLAYILRHGAEKEGLHIRSDGYIRLDDVLARPKMREVDKEMVLRLVEENAKKRFELVYGYDPSPAPPKKGKNKGQQQGQGRKKAARAQASLAEAASGVEAAGSNRDIAKVPSAPTATSEAAPQKGAGMDAATVDDLQAKLSSTQISPSTELPLIVLPDPDLEQSSTPDARGGYYIRASQGHSIQLEGDTHLTPVKDDEEGRKRVGVMVHGTRRELWETLKESGLSRMSRQHIHLAPALLLSDHRITPRNGSTLLIYLDLGKLLGAGIPVYTSANGVVLTPGDAEGRIGKEMWSLAERVHGGPEGKKEVVWRDGKEVAPVE